MIKGKRILMIGVLAMVAVLSVVAQTMQEVVQLKNGHKVRGKIVQYAPLDSVVIEEPNGHQQTIYWTNIQQITRERWMPQQSVGKTFTGKGPQQGYRGFVDVFYNVGLDGPTMRRFGVTTTHGYQFLPYLFAGAGVGMNQVHSTSKNYLAIPVFADLRLDLLRHSISPFIDVKMGWTLGDKAFGLMFNPSIGARIGLGDSPLAINVALGYSLNNTKIVGYKYAQRDNWIIELDDVSGYVDQQHALSFSLGLEF